MEETKQEVPTMSPFCEAIMHNTEDLNTLKGERDCSIIMCSDGDSLAVRMAGNFGRVMNMIFKKMIVDPAFVRLIFAAVNCYIGHLSSYLTPAKDSDYESDIDDKEKTFEDDSPMTRKIKEFMAIYNIVDIKMRMLKVSELKKIMGFPEDYVLIGTQSEQKKFIGNAVEVNMSRVLCEALCQKVEKQNRIAI